jgi:GT2 family glycosyltransferase
VVKYSILIVGYNSRAYLDACLDSVFASDHQSYEVLFLDNGGGAEAAFVNKAYPKARVFLGNNAGLFAGGVNYLSVLAQGEFLILLNPDTMVDPQWLQVLDCFNVDAGQLDLRTWHGVPETSGYFLDRLGLIVHARRPGRIFGGRGAALLIRAAIFLEAGGMDEEMGMYFEETDLCWRVNLLGYAIRALPGTKVYHKGGGSGAKGKAFLFYRNRAMSLIMNYELKNLLLYFPIHCLVSLARPSALYGIAAALWRLPRLIKARARVQAIRQVPDSHLFKTVMVWSKWFP